MNRQGKKKTEQKLPLGKTVNRITCEYYMT